MIVISPNICLKCSGLKVVTKIVGLFFAATNVNRLMLFAMTNKLCKMGEGHFLLTKIHFSYQFWIKNLFLEIP